MFQENVSIWRLSSFGSFIFSGRRGHLKEGVVHKLFVILGGTLIGGRRLKEGKCLLEDLPYIFNSISWSLMTKPIALLRDPIYLRKGLIFLFYD